MPTKSKIEWTDYTLNPIKGLCPVDCKDNQGKSYCYARAMYKRFKWNPDVEWCPRVFRELDKLKAGSRVFVGSTMELFGEWVKDIWLELTFEEVSLHPDLTFIFLTKQPQNLPKFSPFPDNCWVGFSATNPIMFMNNLEFLHTVEAKIKFCSLEPLLEWSTIGQSDWEYCLSLINWVIIGAQTGLHTVYPKIEWVREIVEACDKVGIPVFLKNNLKPLIQPLMRVPNLSWFGNVFGLRQEPPK